MCAISETATPHRMGAALTYARRYALFSLVGIAGEDDLDAPDLIGPMQPALKAETGKTKDRLNGGRNSSERQSGRRQQKRANRARILESEASTALRDQLIAELKDLNSAEQAADWAHRALASKNSLVVTDAEQVELAFQLKLSAFMTNQPTAVEHAKALRRPARRGQSRATSVDKTVLALPATRRIRDREHVRSVAKQACLVCGRRPADAHHLRFAQSRALGRKVSDEFTIPLCRGHHREVHRSGDEAAWWEKAGIDPTTTARALWLETHPLPAISDKACAEDPTSAMVNKAVEKAAASQ